MIVIVDGIEVEIKVRKLHAEGKAITADIIEKAIELDGMLKKIPQGASCEIDDVWIDMLRPVIAAVCELDPK